MTRKKTPKLELKVEDLVPDTDELIGIFQDLLRLHHWIVDWVEIDRKLPGCYAEVIMEDSLHPERTDQRAFIIFEDGQGKKPHTVGHEMIHIFLENLGVRDLPGDVEEALVVRILEILMALLKERGVVK